MKTIKMMSACLVAALAFTACQKEDVNPSAGATMKSVEVSLENAIVSSRGLAGDKIHHNDAVKVTSVKMFLTDDAGNTYEAKTADGREAAQTWWSSADLANGALQASFHYVDNGCTKIVAVANLDQDLSYSDFLAMENLKIGNEQNAGNLRLYAESKLTKKEGQHTDYNEVDGTTYVSDVYEAALTLAPRISRFEVDGFVVKFNATPKYNEIKISNILFQNYSPECALATGTESGALVQQIADLENQSAVYNWFNDATKAKDWYWDSFDLTLTPQDNTADTPQPLAYHIFSGKSVPTMVIKLLADNQPAYLYSRGFYLTDGTPVTEFEEGKIYRMSAKGEVENDGSIPIDEDDIDPMDRCLDITVDVIDWTVELVYPEF